MTSILNFYVTKTCIIQKNINKYLLYRRHALGICSIFGPPYYKRDL